jgi:hypothetical protein
MTQLPPLEDISEGTAESYRCRQNSTVQLMCSESCCMPGCLLGKSEQDDLILDQLAVASQVIESQLSST